VVREVWQRQGRVGGCVGNGKERWECLREGLRAKVGDYGHVFEVRGCSGAFYPD
jgi:hypothetical protein